MAARAAGAHACAARSSPGLRRVVAGSTCRPSALECCCRTVNQSNDVFLSVGQSNGSPAAAPVNTSKGVPAARAVNSARQIAACCRGGRSRHAGPPAAAGHGHGSHDGLRGGAGREQGQQQLRRAQRGLQRPNHRASAADVHAHRRCADQRHALAHAGASPAIEAAAPAGARRASHLARRRLRIRCRTHSRPRPADNAKHLFIPDLQGLEVRRG